MFTLVILVMSTLIINVFVVSVGGYHVNSKTNIKEEVKDIHTVYNPIIAKRGRILDREGTILVEDSVAYTLYANIDLERFDGTKPAHVVDKEKTAEIIAEVLEADYDFILTQLNQEDVKQVEFGVHGKEISETQKEKLEEADLSGLGFIPIEIRAPYSKSLGSTLIGLTRFNEEENRQVGIMGIESSYDDILKGANGVEVYRQDRDQYRYDNIEQFSAEALQGKDIKLTINKNVQSSLDGALNNLLKHEEIEASEAWAAIMEVKTGKILALSDAPNFDVEKEDTLYLNRVSEYQFEPGSTMKTITYAIALNEGLITPETQSNGNSFYYLVNEDGTGRRVGSNDKYTFRIQNVNLREHGYLSMRVGYQVSSNAVIADLMTSYIPFETFRKYIHQLGFFKETGFSKIPESEGYELWNYSHEKITNGFGQGSSVTALQLLQAHTAIFGDGSIVKPHIIDSIINPNNNEIEYMAEVEKGPKIFSDEALEEVRFAMYDNVNNQRYSLERMKMDEVSVMAKTGTSQIVVDGKYSDTDYIHSMMIGFPYEDPEYAFYYAYQTYDKHNRIEASNQFKNVIKSVINNYPINTNKQDENDKIVNNIEMKNFVNRDTVTIVNELKEKGHEAIVLGDGDVIIRQYPERYTQVLTNEKIILDTNAQEKHLPDLTGWSVKELDILAEFLGIEIKIEGSGYVTEQDIEADSIINKGTKVGVILE